PRTNAKSVSLAAGTGSSVQSSSDLRGPGCRREDPSTTISALLRTFSTAIVGWVGPRGYRAGTFGKDLHCEQLR
ncbi:unnamed protein product, partial [Mycena citricolor]